MLIRTQTLERTSHHSHVTKLGFEYPVLNSKQLFAMELIVSSTEVTKDGQPLRRGPHNTATDIEVDN